MILNSICHFYHSSAYEEFLIQHLKVCNARPKESPPEYFKGINLMPQCLIEIKSGFSPSTPALKDLNILLENLENLTNVKLQNFDANGIKLEKKHLTQQQQIIKFLNIDEMSNNNVVVEFGAGKGGLLSYFCECFPEEKIEKAFAVDKCNFRRKVYVCFDFHCLEGFRN